MSERFQKIYTTLELEEAHVAQALMRRQGLRCWMLRSNGVLSEDAGPLMDVGYKLFVPESEFSAGLEVFRTSFGGTGDGPYTGPLDLTFVGKSKQPRTQLEYDPVGPEEFIWNPPRGSDLIGDAWKTNPLPSEEQLKKTSEPVFPTCDKCGHDLPVGAMECLRCGTIR